MAPAISLLRVYGPHPQLIATHIDGPFLIHSKAQLSLVVRARNGQNGSIHYMHMYVL